MMEQSSSHTSGGVRQRVSAAPVRFRDDMISSGSCRGSADLAERPPVSRRFAGFLACLLAVVLGTVPAAAQTRTGALPVTLFRNLDKDQLAHLAAGGTLFREPSGWKDLSVPASAPFYSEIEETVRKGGHNYLGEVLVVMPRSQATAVLPALAGRLLDFEHYAGIPYWSKQKNKYYELYNWVRVSSGSRSGKQGSVATEQFMKPFGEYGAAYTWSIADRSLSYSGINTTPLFYDSIKAVLPGNMLWRLEAYAVDDVWVFYGLGAVKAFDLFGALRDRLSTSFMGRIEAFFKHIYGELPAGYAQ
jgi:hypothetical protein